MKTFILQHKKDSQLFIRNLPFGSMVSEVITTDDIERAEKIYQYGSKIKVYRSLNKLEQSEFKELIKQYKLVEVETTTRIKGKTFEQVTLEF